MKYIDQVDIKGNEYSSGSTITSPWIPWGTLLMIPGSVPHSPTINHALDEGAKLIITSHLGRPKGQVKPQFSLAAVARRLSRLLQKNVTFVEECIGERVKALVNEMKPGDIIMLENLRFHPGEEKNDDAFARELASLADVYIDDAFGNAHRKHASNVGITKYVPVCAGGFLMKKKLSYFRQIMENPARPFVAIIGGSKVSGKIEALTNLIKRVDKMIVGGGMAFTFLKALGYEVGKSLVEDELIPHAREVMESARQLKVKFYLPVDCVMAERISADAESKIVPIQEMNSNWTGVDIGPATITLFSEALTNAKTIVWNGPWGI